MKLHQTIKLFFAVFGIGILLLTAACGVKGDPQPAYPDNWGEDPSAEASPSPTPPAE